jgi:histone H3/H4
VLIYAIKIGENTMSKKSKIPKAVIDRIMREHLPDYRISGDAKTQFENVLLDVAEVICRNALVNTKNAKRKTVMPENIQPLEL